MVFGIWHCISVLVKCLAFKIKLSIWQKNLLARNWWTTFNSSSWYPIVKSVSPLLRSCFVKSFCIMGTGRRQNVTPSPTNSSLHWQSSWKAHVANGWHFILHFQHPLELKWSSVINPGLHWHFPLCPSSVFGNVHFPCDWTKETMKNKIDKWTIFVLMQTIKIYLKNWFNSL